jgi:phosphoenolpyruvate carboxykinase (diphosphate)
MTSDAPAPSSSILHQAIELRLSLLGCPAGPQRGSQGWTDLTAPIFARHREMTRQMVDRFAPVDGRVQHFLNQYLADIGPAPTLPLRTFVLDQPGLARELSLPERGDAVESPLLKSYRLRNGVLHNPAKDRRTTQGVFHVAEGGLPVPDDKLAVPKVAFAKLLGLAFQPPPELLRLPYTADWPDPAEVFVSLLLRPLVVPTVPGFTTAKRLETRFFAPGSLVSNLDFVEAIFGNAGDPYLPENDAALDIDGWTGHTGCVVLAPHLTRVPKILLGLPHWDLATPRQRRDGMCWKTEDELYNAGSAFKLCARDARGVVVTLIADNYYGYCKKEVKTQISYSANLYGLAEEEHAGGALVCAAYDLGEDFSGNLHVQQRGHSFTEVAAKYAPLIDVKPDGYAVDREYSDVLYVPEDVSFDLPTQRVRWTRDGREHSLPLRSGCTYIRPSGYKVHLEQPPGRQDWQLVGTVAEGTLCHKPCTVSGGGKSEISKAISDAILPGPVFVADFERDMERVADLLARDYSGRFREEARRGQDRRPILSSERSLGSVIKLLTPAQREYTDEYNAWLEQIPQYLKELVYVVKRHYRASWGEDWRRHFTVDIINGHPGNELKCDNRKLTASYLRVGYRVDGSWRVFGLREDFHPAAKVQMEDDITASVVVPATALPRFGPEHQDRPSQKFVENCERRLFQRPDDAIHRGYDKQTERDLSRTDNFISNFEPLTREDAGELVADAVGFSKFTAPMQGLIQTAAMEQNGPKYFVSSAHPRIVDGKPSKNPRYLQVRPDLVDPRAVHVARMATRLHRRLEADAPVYTPVDAVVPGRRNNPPEAAARIRSLAVFNPIHYLELPELFMEFISSMTGKSPSTTGAGSEGALTKGPFNALPAIIDLNAALVSYLLTGHAAFVSAAGYVGPNGRVDHDVSLLVPEVWCRMSAKERDPRQLITEGYLERCQDFDYDGRRVLASRLGYRITSKFARTFFGRVFNHPHVVFTDEMLRPETQDMGVFVDGIDNICETHRRVAQSYFDDGTVELACPPLRALLHIMAGRQDGGPGLNAPELRTLFTREALLASDWYAERLAAKQRFDIALWERHGRSLELVIDQPACADVVQRMDLKGRLGHAQRERARVATDEYRQSLIGTLGRQPL